MALDLELKAFLREHKLNTLIADGYAIKDGSASVPDAPGFGLKLDESKFAATVKPKFDLKS